MLNATIALFIISLLLTGVSTYWTILNHRRHKINLLISDELNRIVENTVENLKNSKKSELAAPGIHGTTGKDDLFDSPELMATIITVLVKKYGNVRLSINDFMISDEEYVSVYVDGATQDILLSLDHNLAPESALVQFTKTDDTTFH
tara:strand:- start:94 stop:534 length:441 start_codon:yes stop_codon:yes gene_type:complete